VIIFRAGVIPRKIPAQLQVEPRSNRYMLVGTAFDYLLRFDLQRRAPHAVSERWVAEYAPDLIWKQDERATISLPLWKDEKGVVSLLTGSDAGMGDAELAQEVSGRARCVVAQAKANLAVYVKNKSPSELEKAVMAGHALRLAKLDDLYRGGRFDPTFKEAAQEDVEDLLALLAIVPFDCLLQDKVLLLNPVFGESSALVGGADTDLIAGDLLIDFKTTKATAMQPNNLDQLFGYLLLARHEHQQNPNYPEIKRLGLYFCRHGHLWSQNASAWIDRPDLPEVERWFFARAKAAQTRKG
jgi:hypothetical protein